MRQGGHACGVTPMIFKHCSTDFVRCINCFLLASATFSLVSCMTRFLNKSSLPLFHESDLLGPLGV